MNSFRVVFHRPSYIILGIIVAVFLLLLAIWLPNLSFLKYIISSSTYSLSSKLNILWGSLGFLKTNFTPLTRLLAILVVILSGINIALLSFYIKNRIKIETDAGTGILGTITGLLGVGCASCGSVVLSSIIGLGASTSFLGFFPLNGAEFGIFGILLILFSIYLLAKKIQNPLVCKF